jgi:hypothetical protein
MINMVGQSRPWRRHQPRHAGTTSGSTRAPAATSAAAGTAAAASSKEMPDTRTRPALAAPTTPNGRPATATPTTRRKRRAVEILAPAGCTAGVVLAAAALVVLLVWWWSR